MSVDLRTQLTTNLQGIRQRISVACKRAGRSPDEVTLVAVTKYAAIEWVRELVQLGVTELGEARPQQLMARAKELPNSVKWHLIGHLQRNKADDVVPFTSLIHSVDSVRLFEQLEKSAKKRQQRVRILFEVNVSGEASKDGFTRDDLVQAWPRFHASEFVDCAGLMTMAPLDDHPESARPVFRQLRELRDDLCQQSGTANCLPELSMGMSGDFEVAIEEGATLVRIGSSLFDGLSETEPTI